MPPNDIWNNEEDLKRKPKLSTYRLLNIYQIIWYDFLLSHQYNSFFPLFLPLHIHTQKEREKSSETKKLLENVSASQNNFCKQFITVLSHHSIFAYHFFTFFLPSSTYLLVIVSRLSPQKEENYSKFFLILIASQFKWFSVSYICLLIGEEKSLFHFF